MAENLSIMRAGSRLDMLIESKMRREYAKAVKRINKRKWRVPEILRQIEKEKGRERKKLEDELNLLMRKAKIDNELVRKFDLIYSSETEDLEESEKPRPPAPRRKKLFTIDGELETDEHETSSINSSIQPIGKYSKNKTSRVDEKKFKSKANSQTTLLNKTFESGYSSLEEYVSCGNGEFVRVTKESKKEQTLSYSQGGGSDQELTSMVNQVERNRIRSTNFNKLDEISIEAPRLDVAQEVDIAVGDEINRPNW